MNKIIYRFVGLIGLVLCSLAIFADRLGLDNNPDWGRGRFVLLGGGIFLLALSFAFMSFSDRAEFFFKSISTDRSSQTILISLLVILIVIGAYLAFTTPKIDKLGNAYYSQLAISFKAGHLYLPQQPSPELLALENPYDYELRKAANVDFPWDISLYNGHYYLYWGPAPALLLAPLPVSILTHIGDQHLFLVFACGVFLYSSLLLLAMARRQSHFPPWLFGLILLAIGLSAPLTMMFEHPRIYEAAVIGCQLFFIGGCFWAYISLEEEGSPNPWTLGLAALHWALAVGTRVLVSPAVGILVLGILIFVWGKNRSVISRPFITALLSLGIPLLVGASLLGWYNWARFDSPFEIGMKYQLLLVDYSKLGTLFAPWRIPGNFVKYFFRPYNLRSIFPFVVATEDTISNNKVVGLLLTSPFLAFCLAPLFRGFVNKTDKPVPAAPYRWFTSTLTGASLTSMFVILSYFFTSMNYAADFTPSFYILAAIFLGQGYERVEQNHRGRPIYLAVAVVALTITIVSGTLLAFPSRR